MYIIIYLSLVIAGYTIWYLYGIHRFQKHKKIVYPNFKCISTRRTKNKFLCDIFFKKSHSLLSLLVFIFLKGFE